MISPLALAKRISAGVSGAVGPVLDLLQIGLSGALLKIVLYRLPRTAQSAGAARLKQTRDQSTFEVVFLKACQR